MYLKIFLNFILVIFLSIIHFSFMGNLPFNLFNINIILVAIIFTLALSDLKYALWQVVGFGFIFDIYSFLPFGIYLISLSTSVLLINFLLKRFFTNRSLYSFCALIIFFTIFYEFIFNFFVYMFSILRENIIFFIFYKDFWVNVFFQIIFNLLAVFFIFYILNLFSDKLKPVFLLKKRNN